MPRRHLASYVAPAFALTAALLMAAPSRVSASGMGDSQFLVKYHLVNISGAPITQPIDFTIVPPGSVVAPPELDSNNQAVLDSNGQPVTQNPLKPVDPATSLPIANFANYDIKNLTVALGQDDPLTTQGLRLIFGSQMVQAADGSFSLQPILDGNGQPVPGFLPGEANAIDFTLNLAPGTTSAPDLAIRSDLAGIVSLTKTVTQVPEPISLLVWGGLAGLGWARYRRRRAA